MRSSKLSTRVLTSRSIQPYVLFKNLVIISTCTVPMAKNKNNIFVQNSYFYVLTSPLFQFHADSKNDLKKLHNISERHILWDKIFFLGGTIQIFEIVWKKLV